jgi:hypothetical protein
MPNLSQTLGLDLSLVLKKVVIRYSQALLSFGSDQLLAMSEIARNLSQKSLSADVAGLWRKGLEL